MWHVDAYSFITLSCQFSFSPCSYLSVFTICIYGTNGCIVFEVLDVFLVIIYSIRLHHKNFFGAYSDFLFDLFFCAFSV